MSHRSDYDELIAHLQSKLSCKQVGCSCKIPRRGVAMLHCPAHDDRYPKLFLASREDGMQMQCEAGCFINDVVSALCSRDLWPDGSVALPVTSVQQDTVSSPVIENPQPVQQQPKATISSSYVKSTSQSRKSIAERVIDLADVPPSEDIPLLFGEYFVKGASHWLTGQTGIGKSTFCYNFLCALAEGTDLWDVLCEPQNVLYLDLETGENGRARKLERLYQGTPRVREHLFFLREPVRFPDELDEFLNYVRVKGITLVVFDTVRRCFRVKDENDNAQFYDQVVPVLDALKREGVASLTIGHPAKNGGSGARGAGAQEDAGDVNLTLTMHRGEVNDKDGIIVLKVTKNRQLGLGVKPLYLRRLNSDNDRFERVYIEDVPGDTERLGRQAGCAAAILGYINGLEGVPATYGRLQQEMGDEGFSQSTFKRAFKEVREQKKIVPAQDGYVLPHLSA